MGRPLPTIALMCVNAHGQELTTRDRCSSGLQQLLITSRGNINNQNEPIIVDHDHGTNGYA